MTTLATRSKSGSPGFGVSWISPARPASSRRATDGGTRPESPLRASTSSASAKRSEEHTSELQSQSNLVCRLLLEKKQDHHLTMHRTPPGHCKPLNFSRSPFPYSHASFTF